MKLPRVLVLSCAVLVVAGATFALGQWSVRRSWSARNAGMDLPAVPRAAEVPRQVQLSPVSDMDRAFTIEEVEQRIREACQTGVWRSQRERLNLMHAIAPADMPRILRLVDASRMAHGRTWIRGELVARWAETEPAAALAYIETIANRHERESSFDAAVGAWADIDPEAAAVWVRALLGGRLRGRAVTATVASLGWVDPRAALRLAQEYGDASDLERNTALVFTAWAQSSPLQAVGALDTLSRGGTRSAAVRALAGEWAARDLDAAFAWAEAIGDRGERDMALAVICTEIADDDPAEAAGLTLVRLEGNARLGALHQIVSRWAAEDLPAAVAWLRRVDDLQVRRTVMGSLAQEWGAIDPRAALKFALAMPAGQDTTWVLRSIYNTWADSDPAAALSSLWDLPPGEVRSEQWSSLVGKLASRDPEQARRMIVGMPEGEERARTIRAVATELMESEPHVAATFAALLSPDSEPELFTSIARGLAGDDTAAALEWIDAFPDLDMRERALSAVADVVAERDPNAAMALLDRMPTAASRVDLLGAVVSSLAQRNAASARSFAMTIGDPTERTRAITEALMELDGDNFDAVVDLYGLLPRGPAQQRVAERLAWSLGQSDPMRTKTWLESQADSPARRTFAGTLMTQLVEIDPVSAFEVAAMIPAGPARDSAISGTVARWAQQDLGGALAWLQAQPDTVSRREVLRDLGAQLAGENPQRALQVAQLLPAGDAQASIYGAVGYRWSRLPDDAVMQYASGIADPRARAGFLNGVINGLSSRDPGRAAALLSSVATSEFRTQAVWNIANSWAENDPAAAMQWASGVGESAERENAITAIVSRWAGAAPDEAGEAIARLPAGPTRDSALFTGTHTLVQTDPRQASTWATSIADPQRRYNAIEVVAATWYRSEPAAARAWLSQTDLPANRAQRAMSEDLNGAFGHLDAPAILFDEPD